MKDHGSTSGRSDRRNAVGQRKGGRIAPVRHSAADDGGIEERSGVSEELLLNMGQVYRVLYNLLYYIIPQWDAGEIMPKWKACQGIPSNR